MRLWKMSTSYYSHEFRAAYFMRLLVAATSLLVLIVSIGAPGPATSAIAMVTATVLSIYGVVVCRNNWLLVVPFVFLAYCSYSISCAMYFGLVEWSPYLAFSDTRYAWEGASIMLAFTMGITILLPAKVPHFPNSRISSPLFNGAVVVACVIGNIVAAFNLVESSGARMAVTSSLYEYSIIFVIVGLYYASDNKWATAAIVLTVAFRTILDFATGNRITALEMLSVVFIMSMSHRIKKIKVIIIGTILYVALMTVGSLRGSEFSFEAVVQDLVETVFASCGAWDGAYSAYHSSLCTLATEQFYSFSERVLQFPAALLSFSISPVDLVRSPTELAAQAYWHMGGTYLPFFFHFYLGFPGVVVASCLLGVLLRKVAQLKPGMEMTPVFGPVIVWIGVTSFRWIQYGPTQLMRGAILVCVAAAIAYYFASGRGKRELRYRCDTSEADESVSKMEDHPNRVMRKGTS